MIRLTSAQDGTTVYIAPENITFITKSRMLFGEIETTITASDGMLYVTEPPEEVVRKVLEYNLVMKRYPVALSLEKPSLWEAEEKKLKQLAGLEEQKDAPEKSS